mmetsp:Transcript_32083/g.29041  ORF Transcript_32083/g.29041 Transcript_32083/m.29041 type:complete len:207 (-) Transcript_32083:360-980(-)
MNKNTNDTKITPDYVLSLNKPTKGFLCSLSDNKYKIDFISFKIRDAESGYVLFEIDKDPEEPELTPEQEAALDNDPKARTISYQFGPLFFKLKTVGTTLKFSVGDKPCKNFRMIERHYFRDQLIQSFDFTFPFCIPNSVNDWENIYDIPNLSKEVKKEMIDNPYETTSDSFYFVDGDLIMHNKAEYDYSPLDEDDDKTVEEIIGSK